MTNVKRAISNLIDTHPLEIDEINRQFAKPFTDQWQVYALQKGAEAGQEIGFQQGVDWYKEVLRNEDRLMNIVTDHLGTDPDRLDDSSHLTDDLGADSLDRVEIYMTVEKLFGIEITDEEEAQLKTKQTFGDIKDLLRSKGVTI